MGLIPRMVLFGALLAGAVLLPLVQDRKPAEDLDPRAARLEDLESRRRAMLQRWSATAERDSLLQRLSRREDSVAGLRVWLQGFPAEIEASPIERAVGTTLTRVGAVDSAVRVGVLVYNVAPFGVRSIWSTYTGAWVGEVGATTWCVAIVPGEIGKQGKLQSYLGPSVAPCLLFAAFGKPGAGIAAWLRATRYASVGSDRWLSRPRGWRDGFEAPPWESAYDPSWFEALMARRSSRLWQYGLGDLTTTLAPPYQLGTLALRCLAGDPEFCARSVTDTSDGNRALADWPADLILGDRRLARMSREGLGPRPVADWYLSDLIRDHGRERFGQFWQSELAVEQAFRSAFGEELGSWTERWARLHWEESNERAFFGSRTVFLGATLRLSWVPLSIGWSMLAILAVAWAARQKQVT